jgi:hypothetical protein
MDEQTRAHIERQAELLRKTLLYAAPETWTEHIETTLKSVVAFIERRSAMGG